MKLEIELPLVEEAVWLELRDAAADDFHERREALYEIADAEDRERAFAGLARVQFERLGLRERLEMRFAEHPSIAAAVGLCTVSRATSPREEGAEQSSRWERRANRLAAERDQLSDEVVERWVVVELCAGE